MIESFPPLPSGSGPTEESYEDFVIRRFKWMNTSIEAWLHIAVGVSGEVAELLAAGSRENIVEELGDIHFYLTAGEILFNEGHIPRIPDLGTTICILLSLPVAAGDFLDAVKKSWVYNKPFDRAVIRTCLKNLREAHTTLLDQFGIPLFELEGRNIEKLLKRFPKGYSDKDAQERKDKQ